MILALTGSDAAAWGALVTAIGGVVVAIIAAIRGTSATTKADGNEKRLNRHGEMLNTLALNSPPPAGTPPTVPARQVQSEP